MIEKENEFTQRRVQNEEQCLEQIIQHLAQVQGPNSAPADLPEKLMSQVKLVFGQKFLDLLMYQRSNSAETDSINKEIGERLRDQVSIFSSLPLIQVVCSQEQQPPIPFSTTLS